MSILRLAVALGMVRAAIGQRLPAQSNSVYMRDLANGTYWGHGNGSRYHLVDKYDHTNFWDKFSFWDSATANPYDPTNGFVAYQNRSESERLGLIQTLGNEVYLGVDSTSVLNPWPEDGTPGRPSVRITSVDDYQYGLFIIDFTYLPPPTCGTWPAWWMFGPNWPNSGEIDIYEQWNLYDFNRQTFHTSSAEVSGYCGLNETYVTNYVSGVDCDVYESNYAGCSTWDYEGPYGNGPQGGVYALEWTDQFIKAWNWERDSVPIDVLAGAPNPKSWGYPALQSGDCDTGRAFQNMNLVLNIDFCGDTAGNGDEWASNCAAKTRHNSCARWVASNPEAFSDVYFKVKDIKVYSQGAYTTNTTTISGKKI